MTRRLLPLLSALVPSLLLGSCASTAREIDSLFYEQAERPEAGWADVDFSDPAVWSVGAEGEREYLELAEGSGYRPPHRSPRSIALVTQYRYGDFVLDVDAQQIGREYGHRDLCLFFGYQSPERFYYVHLATEPDQNAHNVFLVDGADRRNLLAPQERGVDWGAGWHHLRLERDAEEGTVRVFFDDMVTPVLEARDTTLSWGRVGVGSFDDTGRFANLELRAESALLVQDEPPAFATGG
ncbi:MAG: hypothetical protein AAF682_01625 [Planctomycetota bacterium]